MDQACFMRACDEIVKKERSRNLIGTLGEKTVHAVLKNYLEPDVCYHEVRIDGYYADIARENHIIEIQTGNFQALRKKLDVFLEKSIVTVVYPIPYEKWLIWIDEETGEMTDKRKSPKKGSACDSLLELYKIKQFLDNRNLRILLLFINMEESRLLNGWSKDRKKGSTRFDRIPLELKGELLLEKQADYCQLIPDSLKEPFSVKEFQKAAKVSPKTAQIGIHVLKYVGAVKKTGNRGKAFLYQRNCERIMGKKVDIFQ